MARVRNAYAVAVVVLVGAYFAAVPARPALVGLVGLLAVLAVEYGVRRMRPQRAGAWRLIALSLALLSAGDVVFVLLEAASPQPVPYPAAPDAFYLASYVPLTAGLLWLGRPTSRYSDQTTLIDSVSITLAGSLVVWMVVVRPALAVGLDGAAKTAAVAAWVGYIAVVAASVRVLLSWRRNVSIALLSLALLAFLVSELFYGKQLVRGMWTSGTLIDLGYFAFIGLCGSAALHPSMLDVSSPAHARHTLGPGRLTLIAAGLLIAPTALLVEATHGPVKAGVAIALVSGVVGVLMVVRLSMTGRAYQRRAVREHAARVASQSMVTATTPQDVVAGTRAALRRVVSSGAPVDVELLRPYDREPPPLQPLPDAGPDAGQRIVALRGSSAALAFTAPLQELADLHELLGSLADQAALALARIELIETARAEERERYFRTLVLTSTDVIIISRGGRVEYATPSASSMFGRDIVGQQFDDLVRPTTESTHAVRDLTIDERGHPRWPDTVSDGAEATVRRPDGAEVTVLVQRRDLTGDPTVGGVVTTLRDVTEERALKRDLSYRASHDETTGLANTRAWGEVIAVEGERRRREGEGIGVIFIDLDNFKQINDRFGHPIGDRVLTEVGRRIQAAVRAGDVAARVGGDEFAVLLRGLSSVEDARSVARRLAESLAAPTGIDAIQVECQASIGLTYTEGPEPVPTLVRQADTALYAAKEQGKGRWAEFNAKQWPPHRTTHNGTAGGASGAGAGGRTIR